MFQSLVLRLLLMIIEFQTSPNTKTETIAKLYKLRDETNRFIEEERKIIVEKMGGK
jgi:hypothetical protein